MPRLTNRRLGQINDTLDRTFFTSAGYISSTDDDETTFVTVEFKDNADYCIIFYRSRRGNVFDVSFNTDEIKYNHFVQATPGWPDPWHDSASGTVQK
ncbi:MAG TPA: hypothetical protein VIT23_18570 [Terrimicrobiaceae bacterium]